MQLISYNYCFLLNSQDAQFFVYINQQAQSVNCNGQYLPMMLIMLMLLE